MSYEMFEDLVEAESTLRRDLHVCHPGEAGCLARAIDVIHSRLRSCPSYHDFLQRMAFSVEAIG